MASIPLVLNWLTNQPMPLSQWLSASDNPISANYTVTGADAGSTLNLTGNVFSTITFAAGSTYDPNFVLYALNADTYSGPNTGRGRLLHSSSADFPDTLLYPGQAVLIINLGNTVALVGQSRWRLPAVTTVFVDPVNGSDSNDGLANSAGAYKTSLAAMAAVALNFDLIKAVTIKFADGTYTNAPITGLKCSGTGSVTLSGNNATPANCVLTANTGVGAGLIQIINAPGVWNVQGFRLTSTGSGVFGLFAQGSGVTISYANMDFGPLTGAAHIGSQFASTILSNGNYTISGGGTGHADIEDGSTLHISNVATITGTPTFTKALLISHGAGAIIGAGSSNFSGAASGASWSADLLSLIDTGGTFAALPGTGSGNIPGHTLASDGAYVN